MPHVQQGLKRQKGRFYGMRQPRGTNRLKGKARLMFRKNMTMSIYLCICTCIFIALVFMYAIAWDSKHTKRKNDSVFLFCICSWIHTCIYILLVFVSVFGESKQTKRQLEDKCDMTLGPSFVGKCVNY